MASEIPGLNKLKGMGGVMKDLANRIDSAHKATDEWLKAAERGADRATKSIDDLGNSIDQVNRKMTKAGGGMGKWLKASDKLGKSIINLSTNIVGMGLDFLISSIQRVYELKERWAKATGLLNMKMGALTPNMKTLTKTANQWRGTMRGLTDDFELGAALFTEYAATLETTGKHVKEFSKINLVLARGFNLGGKGAGDLTKSFRAMGTDAKTATTQMAQLSVDAEILGVNTQSLVADLADSGDYMVRFGKAGTKSLIQSAVFLKQFNIGLKDTNALMDTFDRFDSATESTARLNTIFGTTISSMDMLLSQDPAERIEKVRQGLLAQGKTFEKLSYFERRSLTETLNLGEKEVAFLLDSSKAHMSLADFRDKAAKKEVTHQQAQKKMQKQLQKTAQTLFAFGAAMDRITTAIANAIHPLLEALGLAKGGGKEFKSFGQVMSGVTDTIVQFFNKLAKSKQWIGLMQNLADWMKKAAKGIAKFIASGSFVKWVDKAVSGLKLFLKISMGVFALWTGGKVAGMIMNIAKLGKGIIGLGGGGGASAGSIEAQARRTTGTSTGMDRLKRFGKGAGIGGAAGAITGGGTLGGAVGGMAGGALGMLAGPIGAAIGGAVGGWLGKKGEGLIRGLFGKKKAKKTKGQEWEEKMDGLKKERYALDKVNNAMLRANLELSKKIKRDRKTERKMLRRSNKDNISQSKAAKEVAQRSLDLGLAHGKFKKKLESMVKSEGPLTLSSRELRQMSRMARKSHKELDKLAIESAKALGFTEMENQIKAKSLDISSKRAGFGLDTANAIAAMSGTKSRIGDTGKLADQMAGGEFGKASDFVAKRLESEKKMEAHLTERIRQEERNKISGMKGAREKKAAHIEELAQLKLRMKKSAALAETVTKAKLVQEQKLRLDRDEARLLKTSIDMQRFQLAMAADAKFAIAAQGGSSIGLSESQKEILSAGLSARSSFASGGIVSRPTRALIGEAGPEAVIPLKSMARGRGRQPNKFGGAAAQKLVNYAGGGGSQGGGSGEIRVVAGDVYLDGSKVGRHLVRDMIGNGSI